MVAHWTADNVTEVAVIQQYTNGRQAISVFDVRREEDSPVQSARDVLNNFQDHFMAQEVNNWSLVGARYTDHNEDPGVTGFIAPDPAKPLVGASSSSALTPNCCYLFHKNIEAHLGERSGRLYLPGPPESIADEDGRIGDGDLAALNTAAAAFFDGLSGAMDNELVVVHGKHLGGARTIDLVTSLTADRYIATQRRRLRK